MIWMQGKFIYFQKEHSIRKYLRYRENTRGSLD